MSEIRGFRLNQLILTTRFVQGYRFLDRCGETLIRLENVLDKYWLPTEHKPTGGTIKSDAHGMSAQFDSEQLTVAQNEFLDYAVFADAACRIYEVIRGSLDIERINAPVVRSIWQNTARSLVLLSEVIAVDVYAMVASG